MLDAVHVSVAHLQCSAVSLSRPVLSSAARCHFALQGQLISCCKTRVGLSHRKSLSAMLTPRVAPVRPSQDWDSWLVTDVVQKRCSSPYRAGNKITINICIIIHCFHWHYPDYFWFSRKSGIISAQYRTRNVVSKFGTITFLHRTFGNPTNTYFIMRGQSYMHVSYWVDLDLLADRGFQGTKMAFVEGERNLSLETQFGQFWVIP